MYNFFNFQLTHPRPGHHRGDHRADPGSRWPTGCRPRSLPPCSSPPRQPFRGPNTSRRSTNRSRGSTRDLERFLNFLTRPGSRAGLRSDEVSLSSKRFQPESKKSDNDIVWKDHCPRRVEPHYGQKLVMKDRKKKCTCTLLDMVQSRCFSYLFQQPSGKMRLTCV